MLLPIVGIATTTVLIAAGYLIVLSSHPARRYDDDETDSNLRRRLLRWAPLIFAGKPRAAAAAKEAKVDGQGLRGKQEAKKPALEIENLAEVLEDFKMMLVVRKDLTRGKGRLPLNAATQLWVCIKSLTTELQKQWEMCGQVKVVLKIDSEEDMLILQERAKSLMLPTHVTIDAGRTQIAPRPADVVGDVRDGLKLL